MKIKIKFQHYKNHLEATQIDSKVKHLKKKKIDVDSLKKDKKEFIKNNKPLLNYSKNLEMKDKMF